jgi:hypothetical protein
VLNNDPVNQDRLKVAFGSDKSIETVRFDRFKILKLRVECLKITHLHRHLYLYKVDFLKKPAC